MADRAPTGELDGIVVIELSLDALHEVADVVSCLRAGALAWGATPALGAVDAATRGKRVDHVLDVGDEIAAEAARVHDERQEAYRRRAREERLESARRAREGTP